jgi:hypothetical protein
MKRAHPGAKLSSVGLASFGSTLAKVFAGKRTGTPATPAELGQRLADIRSRHAVACDGVTAYANAVTQGQQTLELAAAKLLADRIDAAEAKHLPDALLAQELAGAERAAVVAATRATLANVAALVGRLPVPGGDALALDLRAAVGPLRELLEALPHDPQTLSGSQA